VRRWLALYALSITSIVILAFLVPLAVLVRDLAADRALSAAERQAQTVARFAATIDVSEESIGELDASLLVTSDTSMVLSDGSLLGAALPADIDLSAAQQGGQAYRQPLDDGEAVIVPVFRGGTSPWVVVVVVSGAELTRNVGFAWAVLGGLGALLVLLALAVARRMSRAVVQPIDDLVDATHRLGRGDLTISVEPSGPSELAEVGSAFNTLTGRVSALMDRERETAADISHRLRTPLTALKLDIEALERDVDVTKLQRDVDELERVVGHVINEARRSVRDGGGVVTDLGAVVSERARYWGYLADDQQRSWALEAPPGAVLVTGNRADLAAMLDALLGNIFAHTPPGTGYSVRVEQANLDSVRLTVADDGPGIVDPALLERGVSGGGSTGLGVDIVRRTAETAGGTAKWERAPTGGTVVTVVVPIVGTAS
jgi:signal transduction histidine kinase